MRSTRSSSPGTPRAGGWTCISVWRRNPPNDPDGPGRATNMPDLVMQLPARRPDLVIRPLGDQGQYVVKDPRTGEFFHLGEAEHFLLTQFDALRTAEAVRAAYAERFDEPLSEADL